MNMENQKAMECKLQLLKFDFMDTIKQCVGHSDDRAVFINMFNNLVDGTGEFYKKDIESSMVHVFFNEGFKKRRAELKELEVSLARRNMIALES